MMDDSQADPAAAEMRHRVANTFQLISGLARMRGQRAHEPEARRQLAWMADAIGALGALERHRCDGGVDFRAYVEDMAAIWSRRQAERPVRIRVRMAEMTVSDQAASTLALIMHELVANALAHGRAEAGTEAGELEIAFTPQEAGRMELIVRDGGGGFDPASPESRERFGLWFVRSLAAQVRGEFHLEINHGVTARLLFTP